MDFQGLRIITNLHCNYGCRFCYQKDKRALVLPKETLKESVHQFAPESFQYCTIMGGESTLLPDLEDYIRVGRSCAKEVRLTTNGSLLSRKTLAAYKAAGLTGMNISIASLDSYGWLTKSRLSRLSILRKVLLAKEYFPNLRINIALCETNLSGEIKSLLEVFLHRLEINVTICEDILQTFTALDDPEKKLGARIVEDTGYGLVFLEHEGVRFGCYTHKDNYKHTDLVVTPLGTWPCWDNYCHAVGLSDAVTGSAH